MLSYSDYKAISINGKHTLQQRIKAMDQFNAGLYDILVGTDVIARGMNIPNLSRVILYELPPMCRYEQFVHRVGRVGRAGNAGEAFVFFNPEDVNDVQMAEFLREQLVSARQKVPVWLHEMVENQQKWQKESDERLQEEFSNDKLLRNNELRRTWPMGTTAVGRSGTEPITEELDEDQNDVCGDAFANSNW